MAIKKDAELSTDQEVVIRINNGDLEALKRLQKLWLLRDEEATVTFAVGIMRLAEHNKKIFIEPEGVDTPVLVNPGEKLLDTSGSDDQIVS